MRGKNTRCRLEEPLDAKTDTGGRTRTWAHLPEFYGAMSPLSASEREMWERDVHEASYRLLVNAKQIPEEHHSKVTAKSRVVIINDRNALDNEIHDIIGVRMSRRAGRLSMFDITLGRIN